jgi:hypothetical protein
MKLNVTLYLIAVKMFYSTYIEIPNVRSFREYAALRVGY